jgi:phosphatidylserine/phosphatidylglycerophosphate/cardiolipin synthase-like enzyme
MRRMRRFIQLIISLTILSIFSFASALPEDGLSITPQDGHILFDDSIDSAQVSIDMMMFRLTDKEVVTHLLSARQRGVKVRIILDQQMMNGNSVKAIADQWACNIG